MTKPIIWQPLAETLAHDLEERGFINSPDLRRAFAETPRHLFVPQFYGSRINELGCEAWAWDLRIDENDPSWLTTVYSDQPLVTQCRPAEDRPEEMWPASSSSMPSLMADMIEELGIRPGMTVLEIGTGTGYNAAILCHLLGEENVATIDIDLELVEHAEQRLAALGYHPSFRPAEQSYDRVLATHAVTDIPYEWIRWTKPGGIILTDFRSAEMNDLGAWAVLTVDHASQSATGYLIASRGAFMAAKRDPETIYTGIRQPELTDEELQRRADQMEKRDTELPGAVLNNFDFGMMLWRTIPGVRWWQRADQHGLDAPDGRWANVSHGSVVYGGPGDLWATIESTYATWETAGRPSFQEWTIDVTDSSDTVVTFDRHS